MSTRGEELREEHVDLESLTDEELEAVVAGSGNLSLRSSSVGGGFA